MTWMRNGLSETSCSAGPPSRGRPAPRVMTWLNRPRTQAGRAGVRNSCGRPVLSGANAGGSSGSRGPPKCGATWLTNRKKGLGAAGELRGGGDREVADHVGGVLPVVGVVDAAVDVEGDVVIATVPPWIPARAGCRGRRASPTSRAGRSALTVGRRRVERMQAVAVDVLPDQTGLVADVRRNAVASVRESSKTR